MNENENKRLTPQERYVKKNIKRYVLHLNKKTDVDIFDKFEREPNKMGLLKKLLRKYYKD